MLTYELSYGLKVDDTEVEGFAEDIKFNDYQTALKWYDSIKLEQRIRQNYFFNNCCRYEAKAVKVLCIVDKAKSPSLAVEMKREEKVLSC